MAGAGWKPRHNPWVIALTVTLATFMEVLDSSIANVSLPHIAGSLGATQDEATWVLTSYLVANAVVLPISAYVSSVVGRKRFYMSCVALFAISSLLCGIAPSLPLLLFFRVLQGIGGGGLAPSEQAILADTFEPAQRGKAFALYGLAVVFAPAIGPTLGGWITDNFNWRWIFFINVPVAMLSLYLTHRIVEDPPHVIRGVQAARNGEMRPDWLGFGLVALAFGCLEVVLDKGQEDDWFSSRLISTFVVLAAGGMVCLIVWELWQAHRGKRPVLDLRLFGNRSFAIAFSMMFVLGFMLYGTTVLIPQFLQTVLGYTAESAGMALSLGGIATLVGMPVVAVLSSRVDPRYLLASGLSIMCVALFHMTHINQAISFEWASQARAYQAGALGFLFIPINIFAYQGSDPSRSTDISGLVNLARNIGGSVGTAVLTTVLARHTQLHQVYLSSNLTGSSSLLHERVAGVAALLQQRGVSSGHDGAMFQIYRTLQQQALMLSYVDVIRTFAYAAAVMVPLAFLLKPTKPTRGMPGH